MISNSLLTLTSISQWGLFLGIVSILFGWVEKRESVVVIGQLIFLALGFLAFWILFTNVIYVPEVTNGIIPKQIKVLAFFKGVALFTGLNVLSLLLKLFKLRFGKESVYVVLLFALFLFFMVFSIQQMAS